MQIDFSPITSAAVTGIVKVGVAIFVGTLAYVGAFLGAKNRIDKRLADLVGRLAFGAGAIGTLYAGFVWLGH
ncbi:hypothetical protein P0D88_40940 [Paraburkholderia sp. RL18-103-BIB-C]|uniref:hypothetical protein n=1 Tax=unclassified Paraburkholderia TaxID=2615204 RepID=UPI0038B7C6F3